MIKTDFNDFAKQLEDLAEVARGFEKQNYNMGWAFIKGALSAMNGQVDKALEQVCSPKEIKIEKSNYPIDRKSIEELVKEMNGRVMLLNKREL